MHNWQFAAGTRGASRPSCGKVPPGLWITAKGAPGIRHHVGMPRRTPLPPILFDEPFLVTEAREWGISRGRLSRSDLKRPFRGVRMTTAFSQQSFATASAYLARMPNGQFFSHTTAAVLHGMPLPFWLEKDATLHVTVVAGQRPPQVRGVVGHQVRREFLDVEPCGPFPVTSPLATWADLSTMLGRLDLLAAADFLCAGSPPRYHPAELITAAAQRAGRRGSRVLREVAGLARAGVASPKETETRLLLLDAGFPEPVVAFEVADATLEHPLHPDLSWPEYRVCIEYEGERHRTDRARFRSDITRRERLEDLGWRVIRITDDDLGAGRNEFVWRVRKALLARGWSDTSAAN